MKFKKTSLAYILFTLTINIYAQDYFIVKKDTTFCSDLKYNTTAQGYLKSMEYTDASGKKIKLEGVKNVPNVTTFYIKNIFFDKTPLKADKPDSYIRYTKRAVDGKLKVYLQQQGYDNNTYYTPGSAHGDWSTGGPSGTYRFFLKMPDGTYYKINSKSNLEKYIKPFLLRCAEFKKKYNGDFSTKEDPFMEMIKLYNSLCK